MKIKILYFLDLIYLLAPSVVYNNGGGGGGGDNGVDSSVLLKSCKIVAASRLVCLFKEELQNMFNLISEERVQFFEQNSVNLMKFGWKIR